MDNSTPYFLTTERLGFRPWTVEDLPLAVALWGDAEVTRFIGGPFSEEKIKERLDREIATMNADKVQYWPVFLLRGDEHAGCAGLRPYKKQVLELGIHLRPAYWGRGLADEAGRAIIRLAFETLGAEALFAGHHQLNTASQKMLEKLGFRYSHEEFYAPTGMMHPSYLLPREKKASPSAETS